MKQAIALTLLCVISSGCGNYYTLAAGQHLGAVGEETPVVVRLRGNDFFFLDLGVDGAAMRMRVGDGPERIAYSDKLGYAGTIVLAPDKPGVYPLYIDHLDREGDEVHAEAPLFVWNPAKPVIAVDGDSLPAGDSAQAAAAKAIRSLAEQANIIYLTRKGIADHAELGGMLEGLGYPEGPVLLWRRQRWHIVREGRFPKIVVESRLVSQLSELRQIFPKLSSGVCTTELAAGAFEDAGMQAVIVGRQGDAQSGRSYRASWSDLGSQGISMAAAGD